jgi:hypothetical protein
MGYGEGKSKLKERSYREMEEEEIGELHHILTPTFIIG